MSFLDRTADGRIIFWCPGCQEMHHFDTTWQITGPLECPTVHPSILVNGIPGSVGYRCHSFIRQGKIEYLSDCTHKLAGKTVPMEPL